MLIIKNETDIAQIYISGDIIDDADANWIKFWAEDITGYEFPKDIKEQLDAVKDKPLDIYINSYGGSVSAGLAIANMIKRHKAKTTAIVDAYCCSIATQIFFSADVCRMPKNTYLMVHKPITFEAGNADDFRKTADILDKIQRGLEITYQDKKKDNVTNEQITKMLNEETWFTGDEAAEYFDIELMEPLKAVNCAGSLEKLKALNYKKIPEILKFKDDENQNPPSILFEQQNKQEKEKRQIELAIARARGMLI